MTYIIRILLQFGVTCLDANENTLEEFEKGDYTAVVGSPENFLSKDGKKVKQ